MASNGSFSDGDGLVVTTSPAAPVGPVGPTGTTGTEGVTGLRGATGSSITGLIGATGSVGGMSLEYDFDSSTSMGDPGVVNQDLIIQLTM